MGGGIYSSSPQDSGFLVDRSAGLELFVSESESDYHGIFSYTGIGGQRWTHRQWKFARVVTDSPESVNLFGELLAERRYNDGTGGDLFRLGLNTSLSDISISAAPTLGEFPDAPVVEVPVVELPVVDPPFEIEQEDPAELIDPLPIDPAPQTPVEEPEILELPQSGVVAIDVPPPLLPNQQVSDSLRIKSTLGQLLMDRLTNMPAAKLTIKVVPLPLPLTNMVEDRNFLSVDDLQITPLNDRLSLQSVPTLQVADYDLGDYDLGVPSFALSAQLPIGVPEPASSAVMILGMASCFLFRPARRDG